MASQQSIADSVRPLGTILTVWAHPDDETFTSGGLLAQAVANGQTVICVTATKGEKGVQDPAKWPPEQLADIRTKELGEALNILGITRHHWLGFKDGSCSEVASEEAVGRIKKLIDQYAPDTIITFGPDGLTGHPDHQAVSGWVSQAATGKGIRLLQATQLRSHFEHVREADERFNIFFNLDQPSLSEEKDCSLVLNLPQQLIELKHRALSAMPSQYEKMFAGIGLDGAYKMFSVEAFKSADL